jgi:GTP cyclohydrolase IA
MKPINIKKIMQAVNLIIEAVGDDPQREGLKETPYRVAMYYAELFEGMKYSNEEIANMFNMCFFEENTEDLVVVQDIEINSHCEHHLALMYDMNVSIGYIPNGRVIGISKLARIADMVGRRLQLQERIGKDILDVLKIVLQTENIIIVIKGKHACMTARGIKAKNSITKTATLSGDFKTNNSLRTEFYNLIGG